MKKIIITLFAIFVINNSVLADGHVKRIISTSQTGMGNDIVYPSGKSYIYKAGDAFVEDVGVVHESKNIGDVPVKAIVVAMGVEGQKIMTPVK